MKWNMEIEEIEAVLDKIWDLHDRLSDAIHSISRTHFLNSIRNLRKSDQKKLSNDAVQENRDGFVFVKDFHLDDNVSAVQEAKSLNAIRTALENLEDQLEFFHTVQTQQWAERDAAIARLEQSRIVLALRLAEHHGKKYKVIEEALTFVGDVCGASCIVSPENLYDSSQFPSSENLVRRKEEGLNTAINFLISSFDFVRKSIKLDREDGLIGNATLFAVSMISLLHLHQVAYKKHPYNNRNVSKAPWIEGSSSNVNLNHLDVMLARG